MRRLLPIVCLLALSQPVLAQKADLSDAPPVRRPFNWFKDRHELTAVFGFTMNDPYVDNLSAGVTYRYFFTRWLGVGIDFLAHYAQLDTNLTERITSDLGARPSTSGLGFLIHAGLTFIPIHGKFMLFGKAEAAYDVHFVLGAGYATTKGQGKIEDGGDFSPMVGFGSRFFINALVAVEVEFRDYMLNMRRMGPPSVQNPKETFEQNFMVTFGVSFFFPPEFDQEL